MWCMSAPRKSAFVLPRAEVNWAPRSEGISQGMPKHATQSCRKAWAPASAMVRGQWYCLQPRDGAVDAHQVVSVAMGGQQGSKDVHMDVRESFVWNGDVLDGGTVVALHLLSWYRVHSCVHAAISHHLLFHIKCSPMRHSEV